MESDDITKNPVASLILKILDKAKIMAKEREKEFEGITLDDVRNYFKFSNISSETAPHRMKQLVDSGILVNNGDRYSRS